MLRKCQRNRYCAQSSKKQQLCAKLPIHRIPLSQHSSQAIVPTLTTLQQNEFNGRFPHHRPHHATITCDLLLYAVAEMRSIDILFLSSSESSPSSMCATALSAASVSPSCAFF